MLSFFNILLCLFFCLFLISSFKKALIVVTSIFFFIAQWGSGIGEIRMFPLLAIVAWIIFIIKCLLGKITITYKYPKLFLIGSVVISTCYIITSIQAKYADIPTTIVNLICYFIYPYLLWNSLDSYKNLKLLLSLFKKVFLFAIIYTLIEVIIGFNPINYYADKMGLLAGTHVPAEGAGERYGFNRCFSIFPYVSAMGFWYTYIFLVFYFLKYIYRYNNQSKMIVVLLLSPVCVILSGTRSVIITFYICFFLLFLDKRFYKTTYFRYVVIVLCLVVITLIPFISKLFESIVNTDAVGGSNTLMRLNQLEIAYSYMLQSPIWGNGRMYTWNYAIPDSPALLGAESIWFQLLIDYGIMGCVSYVFFLVCISAELLKYNRYFLLFPLAFFIAKTLSAIIGVEFSALLVFSIIMIKMHQYSIKNISHENNMSANYASSL